MMIVDDYNGINVDNNDDNGDNEAQSREREILPIMIISVNCNIEIAHTFPCKFAVPNIT